MKSRSALARLTYSADLLSALLPPHDDSGVIALSFQARRIGQHEITAELLTGDIAWVSHILRTVTRGQGGGPGDLQLRVDDVVIASVTLHVQCIALAMTADA